jgi:hypothetical protein
MTGNCGLVRRWLVVVASLVSVAWGVWGYYLVKPADYHDYRTAAVHAAQSADDAARTVVLTGRADLAGNTLPTYVRSVLDTAQNSTGGAAKQLTSQAPPDAASVAIRDRLGPLLLAAQRDIGDAALADDRADHDALRAALRRLEADGAGLDDFIEAYR